MSEWFKVPVLKTGMLKKASGVRILPHPSYGKTILFSFLRKEMATWAFWMLLLFFFSVVFFLQKKDHVFLFFNDLKNLQKKSSRIPNRVTGYVAQKVEHRAFNSMVVGSSPTILKKNLFFLLAYQGTVFFLFSIFCFFLS